MAFSVTNLGTASQSSGATLTLAVPAGGVPAGALIVVGAYERDNTGMTPTVADDGNSGNYASAKQTLNNLAGNGPALFAYKENSVALTTSNTITLTRVLTTNQASLTACYITGVAISLALDGSIVTAFGSSTGISVTSGAPVASGNIFIGMAMTKGNSGSFTQASGFSTPPNEAASGTASSDTRVNGGNLVAGDALAKTYNPSMGATSVWAAFIASFRPASGGAAYMLTGAQGNATQTGKPATLKAGLRLPSVFASYTLNGKAAVPSWGRGVGFANGTVTLTGRTAGIGLARGLPATVGRWALDGAAALLLGGEQILWTPAARVQTEWLSQGADDAVWTVQLGDETAWTNEEANR